MIRRPVAAVAAATLLLLTGCGGSDVAQEPEADGPAGDEVVDPDDPVGSEEPMDPDLPMDDQETTWTLVEPRPGMKDVRAIAWEDVDLLDERRLRVRYWSGVEPCHVLDSVEVEETDESVTITLYEGHEPPDDGEPPICIQIARHTAVDVRLDAPVGDREIIDGTSTP